MMDYKQYLYELLLMTAQQGASDLHLSPAHHPTLRIDGRLVPLTNYAILDRQALQELIMLLLGEKKERFDVEGELNFAYEFEQKARFRVSAYRTKGSPAAALRFIPEEIQTVEELNLPPVVKIFTKLSQGFVLVVGPSGHGKSTTMAALINLINRERIEKIVTVEDPIEHVFRSDKSIIDQREIPGDTSSFRQALGAAGRQDANVIMVGAMGDAGVIGAAMDTAEMGRLVFASLDTTSAAQTMERIIEHFPLDRQEQARAKLANAISGVISQRLAPRIKGGLVPAVEVMVATPAVRTMVRDNRLRQLNTIIETSQDMGMISLDRSLANLVRRQEISLESAEFFSLNPSGLRSLVS